VDDRSVDLRAGRVGRPHGLDGSFYVTRALPALLTLGASVNVAGKSTAIVRRAGTDSRPIVRLEGVADRSAAEALRGADVTVAAQQAPALAEGEWWAHELEGCALLDGDRRIGTVQRLIELPSCEALEVARADTSERVLVPMVKDAIRRVDVAKREIEVDSEFLGLREESSHAGAGDEGAGG
jgi:16S rRNA processing protein RimM